MISSVIITSVAIDDQCNIPNLSIFRKIISPSIEEQIQVHFQGSALPADPFRIKGLISCVEPICVPTGTRKPTDSMNVELACFILSCGFYVMFVYIYIYIYIYIYSYM